MLKYTYISLIMERLKLNKDQINIFFTLGAALIFIFLMNALYFLLPYEHLNPYEYFQGSELNHFQIFNLFSGGVGVPLAAMILGSLISSLDEFGTKSAVLTIAGVLIIGVVQSILVFGYDTLPVIALVTIIGCLFLKVNRWVVLASFAVLMLIHIMVNGFFELLINSGLDDQIYTNIQEVNEFSSIFRSSDYLAMVGINLEVMRDSLWTGIYNNVISILPYTLLGITMYRFSVLKYIQKNIGMMTFLALVVLGGGITIKLLQVVSLGSSSIFTVGEVIGGGLLAAGIYLVLLMAGLFLPEKLVKILSDTGRHALTAYVLFNIVMMFLSYGIGFSLYGELSIAAVTGAAFVIYLAVVVIMNLIQRFNIKSLEDIVVINRIK